MFKRLLIVCLGVAATVAATGAGVAAADPTLGVQNADGGIYWRSAPDWNTAEATAGNGFYPDTTITVHCYQAGSANVPGTNDSMWEKASWAGGQGSGSGWVNEHFINDGADINQPTPGVPPCESPSQGSGTGGLPSGQFTVQNADGGIYWRSAPDWNTAEATAGNGFYPDTVIQIVCYQAGAANVPGTNDSMWEKASWVSGQGSGSGWVNEHFINDGADINQPSPGAQPCSPDSGGGTTSGGGSTGGGPGASLFFQPYDHDNTPSVATRSINYGGWHGANCSLKGSLPTVPGHTVNTLAGWSNGRGGPLYYLRAALAAGTAKNISYVLLIDPGRADQFGSCDAKAGKTLRQWLSQSSSAHLVIIAAEATNYDKRAGLRSDYTDALTSTQRSKQVLVCDDKKLPHGKAFSQYASPKGENTAFITKHKFVCPYGVPTVSP